MPDLRDLGFINSETREGTRPALEHGVIASTPSAYNDPVDVILPDFANDQLWGPYPWTSHFNGDLPQAGDECLIAFSNRREGWVLAWWPGSNMTVGGGGGAVASFNGRTGAVVSVAGDYTVAQVTGAAPLANPVFTGDPQAPTPATADNDTSVATTAFVKNQGYITSLTAPVTSVFGRIGPVVAASGDYTVAQVTGAAPLVSPNFTGTPTAPTQLVADNSTAIATTAWVKSQGYITPGSAVTSFNTRTGAVVPVSGDYTVAQVTGAAPLASPTFTGTPAAPTAAVDTNTTQVATTAFVLAQLSAAGDGTPAMDGTAGRGTSTHFARADHVHPTDTTRAPLAGPVFTGDPQAPTPATADNDTSIATTAFVKAQGYVTSGTAPVTSVFSRTGAIVATTGDYTVAQVTGAAPLASPTFTGTPAAPTAAVDTNTTQLATTAFVLAQAASATPGMDGSAAVGTSTRFARGDHIHPTDSTRAPLASPALTGTPTAPTAATADNSTTIATTAFVKAQNYVTATTAPVTSVFGRTGPVSAADGDYYGILAAAHVGATSNSRYVGATISGAPTSGTFSTGDYIVTQNGHMWVCTAAGTPGTWVDVGAQGNLVTSVFTRTGAVVATTGDYTVAQVTGAAPLASPTFTGTPAAPTAAPGTNTTQIATTAFVTAAVVASSSGVVSFNTRTGAVVPASGDYTAAQVTNAADKSSGSVQVFTGGLGTGAGSAGLGAAAGTQISATGTYYSASSSTTGVAFSTTVTSDSGQRRFQIDVSGTETWANPGATPLTTTLQFDSTNGGLQTSPAPAGGPATAADSSSHIPTTAWVLQNAVPPGTVAPFAGDTAPSGWLMCNNQAVSRTTYANLFNVLVTSKGTVTATIATPAVFTTGATHGLVVGDTIFFEPVGGTLPTGLSADVAYVVTAVPTTTTFRISATISIVNGVSTPGADLNTTAAGTATSINLFRAPYAVIGGTAFSSTTFNVPDMRGDTVFGFWSGVARYGAMGMEAGEATHTLTTAEIPAHDHNSGTAGVTGATTPSTPAGTISTPTLSGSTANESPAHSHTITPAGVINGSVTAETAHTHGFTPAGTINTVGSAWNSFSAFPIGNQSTTANMPTNALIANAHTFTGTGGTTGATSHTHADTFSFAGTANQATSTSAHAHGIGTLAVSTPTFTGTSQGSHTHALASVGGGGAHNISPPSMIMNYIIKT